MTAFDQLVTYLSYPFVANALVVGALVALCSSLLGTTLVMKRLSYIGDGLSHVAFGAYAVAAAIGVICAIIGMLASILLSTPVGSTIVVVDALSYGVFSLAGFIGKGA